MKITKEIRTQLAKENGRKSVLARKLKHGKDYNKVMKEMSDKAKMARNKVKDKAKVDIKPDSVL